MKRARCTILPRCCPPWLDGCWLTNQPPSRVASRARQWCPGVDTFVLDPGQGHTSASRKMAEPRGPRPSAPMNGLAASGSGVAQPGSRALNERAERRGGGLPVPPWWSQAPLMQELEGRNRRGEPSGLELAFCGRNLIEALLPELEQHESYQVTSSAGLSFLLTALSACLI